MWRILLEWVKQHQELDNPVSPEFYVYPGKFVIGFNHDINSEISYSLFRLDTLEFEFKPEAPLSRIPAMLQLESTASRSTRRDCAIQALFRSVLLNVQGVTIITHGGSPKTCITYAGEHSTALRSFLTMFEVVTGTWEHPDVSQTKCLKLTFSEYGAEGSIRDLLDGWNGDQDTTEIGSPDGRKVEMEKEYVHTFVQEDLAQVVEVFQRILDHGLARMTTDASDPTVLTRLQMWIYGTRLGGWYDSRDLGISIDHEVESRPNGRLTIPELRPLEKFRWTQAMDPCF